MVEVLLVDDNEDDVLLLRESFKDTPTVTVLHVAHDGEEALAYLRREGEYANARRPGLVLLDINMPRKNGFEVLGELKEDAELCAIPVVMLTTSKREADVLQAYRTGASSFVSKPLGFENMKDIADHFAKYWSLVSLAPVG